MKLITPIFLNRLITHQPSTCVIDVTTPSEFDQLHVPGAFNVPLEDFSAPELVKRGVVSPGEPVYLVCRSSTRASTAAARLVECGVQGATVLEGGVTAWEAAGLPVVRGEGKVISLERQVRIVAGALVLSGVLLGWLVHPGFVALSGFVGAGLVFAGITDWCGMALLLARLPYNRRGSQAAKGAAGCATGEA